MKFNELKLEKNILKALKEAGYSEPTPIQQQAIPPVLEGRDLMGCAQTGTGKTCAFAVPIIQRLAKSEGKRAPSVRSSSPRRASLRSRSTRTSASMRAICR